MLMNAETGLIAGTYRYDAFGNIIEQAGAPQNSITYAGYQYDEESGLYYLNARYYNSATARFLTEDTFRGEYTDPLSLNRYTYCHNNPIAYTDPTGHSVIVFIIIAAVGGLASGGLEIADQKLIQKKEEIDWVAVGFETVAGAGLTAVGFGAAGTVTKGTVMLGAKVTGRELAKQTVKIVGLEAGAGFVADTGRQIIVEGRSFDQIDHARALGAGLGVGMVSLAGITVSSAASAIGQKINSLSNKAGKSISKFANLLDDYVDDAARAVGVNKGGSKSVDDVIANLSETTNGKGIARNFESTGGFKQTIKDFESLNPLGVKEIQTQYGVGKVGKLSDGTTVVARPGSTTGGATLEIRVSNSKVYKIRY